jgi:hypothetical protein
MDTRLTLITGDDKVWLLSGASSSDAERLDQQCLANTNHCKQIELTLWSIQVERRENFSTSAVEPDTHTAHENVHVDTNIGVLAQ